MNILSYAKNILNFTKRIESSFEEQKFLTANVLIDRNNQKKEISSLSELEFKIFSQWGDDGIIQWLINNIQISHNFFIEFGVEDYTESTTRFLLMNNNWSGLIMDGSKTNIKKIKSKEYYWKYDLMAINAFITRENINIIIKEHVNFEEIGILHIDIDGNDYWIWEQINTISPTIVIMEYNSLLGIERAITIPYEPDFVWTKKHYSNLYFGASLRALCHLAEQKGYAFIGCNSGGMNAYFIKKDKINNKIKEITVEKGFVESKFRQSRDDKGNLSYLPNRSALELIKGMPVFNVLTNQVEPL
jgi:hypothetical protein